MTEFIQLTVAPAVLIVPAGLLVRRMGADRTAERRFLFFLLAAGIVLLLVVFVAARLPPVNDNRLGAIVAAALAPVILGVLVLLLVHLNELARLRRVGIAVALVLGVAGLGVSVRGSSPPFDGAIGIVACASLLIAMWALARRPNLLAATLSLVVLALLALANAMSAGALDLAVYQSPVWLSLALGSVLIATPVLAVALAAALVSASLRLLAPQAAAPQADGRRVVWWPALWQLALAVIVLGYLAYSVVWASIWDQTSDGLWGGMLSMEAEVAAVAAGMLIGATSSGWRRLAGLGFAILVPAAMFASGRYGWQVSYKTITEARAANIQAALERFHTRIGRYPEQLGELVPRDLLWIPGQLILRGQDWCYQGGPDYYHLAAFYRESFSSPLSLRLYAAAGDPPEAGWACGAKLAEMKTRYDPPPAAAFVVPTQPPLPTSVVPVQRTAVQPALRAGSIYPGNWSPDGQYLVLGLPKASGNQSLLDLDFLDARTGALCPAGEKSWLAAELRQHFAWLPDGRLLFVSEAGEMVLFKPCQTGTTELTGHYSESFTLVDASDETHGQVLLHSQTSYWILGGRTLAIRPIPAVSPNSDNPNAEHAAWSPDGKRLAISQPNGTNARPGSTLYLLASDTGMVEKSVALQQGPGQGAPWVEWLTQDQLLLSGSDPLTLVDLRSDPPGMTNVFKDLLHLDIASADDISAEASVANRAGGFHIAVRVNRPHNQAVYVYHSESGQVEVLQPESEALLIFPDGEWAQMPKMPGPQPEHDEYALFQFDTPGQAARPLVVEGHLPRTYPSLSIQYLANASQLAFASSQGVSLVSLADGALLNFWQLSGAGGSPSVYLLAPPDGEALMAVAEGVGLYYLPLP